MQEKAIGCVIKDEARPRQLAVLFHFADPGKLRINTRLDHIHQSPLFCPALSGAPTTQNRLIGILRCCLNISL